MNVAPALQDKFWRPGVKRLLMSATVGDASQLVTSLGAGEYLLVEAPSPISPERRPIFFWPQADVTEKKIGTAIPLLAKAVETLMGQYLDQKGVVHTVNSDLARWLSQWFNGGQSVFTHDISNRAEVFNAFREATPPAVLISPSANVGEDFAYTQAGWQVIAKVSYPPLGNLWVQAKRRADPRWYELQTIQALVQAAGRIVRAPDDWGVTYILDQQFERLYSRSQNLFPDWFHEGLKAAQDGQASRG